MAGGPARLDGIEDGRADAHPDRHAQLGHRLQDAAGNALLVVWQRAHYIHVCDAELKIRPHHRQQQSGEDKCPVAAARMLQTHEQEGPRVRRGPDRHEQRVGHPMHDEPRHNVDQDAANRHGEQVHGHHEGGVVPEFLQKQRDPEGHDGEGEKAQQQNRDDQGEVPVAPDEHGN